MAEAVRRDADTSWLSVIWSARHDPAARIFNIDLVAALIAILLPWTTTGVAIAAVLWADRAGICVRAAGVAALAEASRQRAADRLLRAGADRHAVVGRAGGGAFASVEPGRQTPDAAAPDLSFPALAPRDVGVRGLPDLLRGACDGVLHHGDRSESVRQALSLASGPTLPASGIFVRNYIDQGQEFSLCAVALAYPVVTSLRDGQTKKALLLAAVALALVANMMFIVTSRTALVTMPVMLVIFLLLHLRGRVAVAALCGMALLVGRGLVQLAAFADHGRKILHRLPRDHDPEQRERHGLAADLLGQVAEIPSPMRPSSGTARARRAACSKRLP